MPLYLMIQWYHTDGKKNGPPSPVGFVNETDLRAFTRRLDRFNVLYTVVNGEVTSPTGEYDDSLSLE